MLEEKTQIHDRGHAVLFVAAGDNSVYSGAQESCLMSEESCFMLQESYLVYEVLFVAAGDNSVYSEPWYPWYLIKEHQVMSPVMCMSHGSYHMYQ